MKSDYLTVRDEAVIEFEEKKSRFIGYCKPIHNEEEAIEFIKSIKKKHWDASHNVWAYYLKDDSGLEVQRYSDEGEPQGTAGIPTLESIRKKGLEDVVVVVTRYFGGTLLGAGGLIRAYGKTASLAILEAGLVRYGKGALVTITVDYSLNGMLQNLLKEKEIEVESIEYGMDVDTTIKVSNDRMDEITELIVDRTSDSALISVIGEVQMAQNVEG